MDELRTPEEFYENMIWIVDGMRGDLDKNYFNMGLSGQIQTDTLTYQVTWWGQGKLLQNWSDARAMVFLDFGEEILWRLLLFDAETKVGTVGPLPRKTLIRDCLNGVEISVTKLDEKEIGSSN